jgi:superfamily II DNA or RNA helicase
MKTTNTQQPTACDYATFLDRKTHLGQMSGFDPLWMPDFLFPFQRHLVTWAIQKGRAAIFADCGLGKTPMQLVWAQNVVEKTCKPVLILTPLAVGAQTVREANKFGIEAKQSRDGKVAAPITVTNYEQLHKFTPSEFGGLVCDESSILKHFSGATQKQVTRFMTKLPYRLLCTATAAPNDYTELGTSSEALGGVGYSDMLTRFFKQEDSKASRKNDVNAWAKAKAGNHFAKLSYRVSQATAGYRFKGHAKEPFWRWVCSWAKACRYPSDVGFSDEGFILPDLIERDHTVMPTEPPPGEMFTLPAFGLKEEREERKRTTKQRCQLVADIASHSRPCVVWCHMNDEGRNLSKMIPGAVEVCGSTDDDERERIYEGFADGSIRALVIKPKIGAWGLNWQHCSDVVTFGSHSYEQYYQSIRRCWRFGQKKPVTVDIVVSEGEKYVLENMKRKGRQAAEMFAMLVKHMNNSLAIETDKYNKSTEVPSWL